MNEVSKKSKAEEAASVEKEVDSSFSAEMDELKREMHTAQIADWMQRNQQQLIAAIVAVILILAGGSLWLERNKSQKDSAATLYHQALASSDAEKKKAMLEMVIKDYDNTGYGSLARLYMAKLSDQPEGYLKALIQSAASTPELAWQARLDLAEWYLTKGKIADANAQLSEPVGKQYEQLRHYLMAEASTDPSEKRKHLQMSLDSVSNDQLLKDRIESMLAELGAVESSDS